MIRYENVRDAGVDPAWAVKTVLEYDVFLLND